MPEKKIDAETIKITQQNKELFDLVNHAGWKIARPLIDKMILALQDVSEYADIIQTGNATKLLKEMKARILAAEILYRFLSDIEGGAASIIEEKVAKKPPSYIYDIDKEK